MGGICSRRSAEDSALVGGFPHANGRISYGAGVVYLSGGLPAQGNDNLAPSRISESTDKKLREPFTFPDVNPNSYGMDADIMNDGIPRLYRILSHKSRSTMSKQVAVAKVSEVSSILGRAGTAGLGKAVEVLDTLGSSMTSLNIGSGFVSGAAIKGNKLSILCFEVANTVVKGANLMRALSTENIKHLKEAVLPSEGVQLLISKDTEELLRIAEADKRDELRIFSSEVVRFGNRCKDPQWHNLDRYFEKLEPDFAPQKQLKEEADSAMRQMMTLVQETADLYHELHALDRFEQDYQRKLQEEDNSSASQRGDSLAILKAELKSQKKHVRGLKKKSLWCRSLEEVMEKLVEIVHFLQKQINDTFGGDRDGTAKCNHQKLGSAGLALHYANIIIQIDTLVTRSSALPPSTRDSLYHGLPPSIKCTLRSKLHSCNLKEELTVPQIKAEMEKTLQWLVPIATNTSKAHHGFGWVGEWANTGSEMNDKPAGQTELIRIETLHHANKEKTELYILELVVWLHHLVAQTRACNGGIKSPVISPIRSPNQKTIPLSHKPSSPLPTLTVEDQEILRDVSKRKLTPGLSKSQEFDIAKTRFSKDHRLSKSSSHSPTCEFQKDPFPIKRLSSVPIIDFDFDKVKALDVIDRVDDIQSVSTV